MRSLCSSDKSGLHFGFNQIPDFPLIVDTQFHYAQFCYNSVVLADDRPTEMKCWPFCYLTRIKTENWKAWTLVNRKVFFFCNRNAAFISFSLKGSFTENSSGLIGTAPAIICRLFLLINSVVFEQICGAPTAGHHSGAYCSTSLEMCGMSRIFPNRLL